MKGSRRSSGGCCRWSSCGRTSSFRSQSCATRTAAPTTPTSARSTAPPISSRWPRTSPSSTAGPVRSPDRRGLPSRAWIRLGEDPRLPARSVARAVERLLDSGIAGPYGLALGPRPVPAGDRDRRARRIPACSAPPGILDGPIVWAPGINGGILVSLRGGDFVFDCGQDISIGYDSHDGEIVSGCTSRRASASTPPRPRRPSR